MRWGKDSRDDKGDTIHGVRGDSFLGKAITRFLELLEGRPPIGETSVAQDVKALLEMVQSLQQTVADVPFIKEELSTVHQLVADLSTADQQQINQLAAQVRILREKLQTSIDKQGD